MNKEFIQWLKQQKMVKVYFHNKEKPKYTLLTYKNMLYSESVIKVEVEDEHKIYTMA